MRVVIASDADGMSMKESPFGDMPRYIQLF